MPQITTDDGVTLHAIAHVQGPLNVLFLHLLGGDSTTWEETWAAMDPRGIRCIALDWRGTGKSQREPCELTAERLCRDMLLVADYFGADQFVIVGHSMGAKLALYAVPVLGPRLLGLVLIGSPGPDVVPLPDDVLDPFLAAPGDRQVVETFFRGWLRVWPRPAIDRWIDSFATLPPWALQASVDATVRSDHRSRLNPPPSCPVLVFIGEHDVVYGPPYQQKEVLPHLPGAQTVLIDAGHGLVLERPEKIAAHLNRFLATLA